MGSLPAPSSGGSASKFRWASIPIPTTLLRLPQQKSTARAKAFEEGFPQPSSCASAGEKRWCDCRWPAQIRPTTDCRHGTGEGTPHCLLDPTHSLAMRSCQCVSDVLEGLLLCASHLPWVEYLLSKTSASLLICFVCAPQQNSNMLLVYLGSSEYMVPAPLELSHFHYYKDFTLYLAQIFPLPCFLVLSIQVPTRDLPLDVSEASKHAPNRIHAFKPVICLPLA